MRTWEYMTWVVAYARTDSSDYEKWGGGAIKYINGILVPDWKASPRYLVEQLNKAGKDGWELVTVESGQGMSGMAADPVYLFKRPRPE